MTEQCMLTTFDNPYNPFTNFNEWFLYDMQQGYNTCGYLDRIANLSNDLSDEEAKQATEAAIDRILDHDFLNIYKKVRISDKNIVNDSIIKQV